MKLVYKTLHQKQMFTHGLLIVLLFLSMLSLQVTCTVFTKNQSMAKRIEHLDVATTTIFSSPSMNFDTYLKEYQEQGKFNFTYEKGSAWPYLPYSTSWMQSKFPLYLESYIKSDDAYPLLEGKPCKELKGNEIAVMNGYANALRKQGIEPLHHRITLQDDMGNAHTFQIESIMYYTNYEDGYVNHKNEDAIKDYQILPPAVGIVKQETLQNLRNDIIKTKGEGATGAFSTMLKVRFDAYDMQDEYEFRQDALDTYYLSSADFRLLADELNGNQVQDAIFRFVSMSVTACLLLSCLFVLYAFLKRKLLDDQEKLSILVINGITKRNIQRAYDLEYGRLFVFAILYLILFDLFTYLVLQQQSDYILRLLFTMSWETAKWLLPLLVAFIIVLMLMIRWQVHRCFHGNLFRQIKGKHLSVKRKRRVISYRFQPLHMAMRQFQTDPFMGIRNIFSLAVIFLTILLLSMTQGILSHLYTPATFGLQFDYQIAAGMPYDDYEKIKPYIKEYALLEMNKEENGIMKEYMVNDRSTRESVDFRYFPGMRLVLTGELDEFLPLREGSYPRIPDEKHNGIDYSKERAMVPRRIQYDFDKYIANSDYVNQHPEYANDTYAEFVEGFSVHGAAIYGFTESIMNQGYVAFTSRRKSPVDKVHYPYLPKMLVKVKDEKAKADMEKMMKQSALTYNSYDSVLAMLQENNDELNQKLRYVMSVVFGMEILVLAITLYANIMADKAQQKAMYTCFARIGVKNSLRRRKEFSYEALMLLLAFLMTALLYILVQYPYFNVLGIYLGVYELPSSLSMMPMLMVILVIVLSAGMLFYGKAQHKKVG